MTDLLIRGDRVVLPGGIGPASLRITNGRVHSIEPYGDRPANVPCLDAGELVVLPGVVDTHVHINEPGRAHWEGIEHATRAAAAGGVTTVIDMPLNSIPATTSVAGFAAKRDAVRGRCAVDVGFWGGVVPGNASELEPLRRAGVLGFKCFLSPSGVDEFVHVGERELRDAMPILARLGVPLLAHAELPALLQEPGGGDPRQYATWLDTRPAAAETAAIELLIGLAGQFGARVHIVHLATAEPLKALHAARARGVPITVETCPHYLTFAAEEIAAGATALKCAPPIRERSERDALWRALQSGDIDGVVSDHSPAPAADKCIDEGDFLKAWGGIASLQLGLPLVWTGARSRHIPLESVVNWMSNFPAGLAGLAAAKGAIRAGGDADLVFWDPDAAWVVDPSALFHRHPVTPYAGMTVHGQVRATILRGDVIYKDGEMLSMTSGRMIGSA